MTKFEARTDDDNKTLVLDIEVTPQSITNFRFTLSESLELIDVIKDAWRKALKVVS